MSETLFFIIFITLCIVLAIKTKSLPSAEERHKMRLQKNQQRRLSHAGKIRKARRSGSSRGGGLNHVGLGMAAGAAGLAAYSTLSNSDDAIASSNTSTAFDDSSSNITSFDINPANGLPMVDGIGSIDIGGNTYGTDSDTFDDSSSNTTSFDINPASGLPMVDGIGSIDIGGNTYGTDSDTFDDSSSNTTSFDINPASGLPMVDGIGSIDIGGNTYGTDSDTFDHSFSSFDDSFSSFDDSFSSFDDSFSSSSFDDDW